MQNRLLRAQAEGLEKPEIKTNLPPESIEVLF